MRTLSGSAPAKVNLGLRILGRRPDGYHELRTVLQTISLADRLTVGYDPQHRSKVSLECNDPGLAGEDNLAVQAASALLEAGRRRGHVAIELTKRIPAGAGLGGGSSDAAAVLLALGRLLQPPPAPDVLFEVAARLGSDVPFFLLGGTAVGVSRGEEVYPLPDPPRQWMVLLVPEVRIPTATAYEELDRSRKSELTPDLRRNIIKTFCSRVSVPADREAQNFAGALSNDFEVSVFRRFPILHDWKKRLHKAGASFASLSGSGSAVFGVFQDRRAARTARDSFDAFPGKVYLVRAISRRAYHSLWS